MSLPEPARRRRHRRSIVVDAFGLLRPIATTAFQTLLPLGRGPASRRPQGRRPALGNPCRGWRESGEAVREIHPAWYRETH